MSVERVNVEMQWRCPDGMCAKENLGRDKTCVGCGRPKGIDVKDYFPDGDGSSLPEVSNIELLKLAQAGADRVCKWCNTAQTRLHQMCQNCGGDMSQSLRDAQDDSSPTPTDVNDVPQHVAPVRSHVSGRAIGLIVAIIVVIAFVLYAVRPKDVPVTVASVVWIHTLKVERHVVQHGEGFRENVPTGAFNEVVIDTDRWHHNEQVVDHYEKVDHPYDEQVVDHYEKVDHPYDERVQDGTETYACTKSVRGQDSCRQTNCRREKNGFGTCDKVCNPTYTTVPDTCSRPRYRTERRHRYTDEPVYRSEPRTAPWYEWDVWAWVRTPARDAVESGQSTVDLRDPSVNLAADERALPIERSYDVTVVDKDGKQTVLHPTSQQEFKRYTLMSKHVMRIGVTGVTMDPPD